MEYKGEEKHSRTAHRLLKSWLLPHKVRSERTERMGRLSSILVRKPCATEGPSGPARIQTAERTDTPRTPAVSRPPAEHPTVQGLPAGEETQEDRGYTANTRFSGGGGGGGGGGAGAGGGTFSSFDTGMDAAYRVFEQVFEGDGESFAGGEDATSEM